MQEWKLYSEDDISLIPTSPTKQVILAIGHVQSGKTKFMLNEAKKALASDYDIAIVICGNTNLLFEQSFYRFADSIGNTEVVISDVKTGAFTRKSKDTKLFLTSLKHQDSLEKIIQVVGEFPESKFIIFDDESDFGSINISKNSESLIFSKLKEIYKRINRGTFVSVTATPFADILSPDGFKFNNIIRLKPGGGYTGLKHFNNSNSYSIIDDDVSLRNGNDKKTFLLIIIDHIKRVYNSKKQYTQMLVNTDLKTFKHELFAETINSILDLVNKNFYNKFCHDFIGFELTKVKKICEELQVNIFMLNQTNTIWEKRCHSIIVGGSLVSRGYTFENLITAIMVNVPNSKIACDTLLQRARWFGYRDDLFNTKIFLSERAVNAYREAEKLNDIIFSDISSISELREKIMETKFEVIEPTGKVKTWKL